MPKTFQLGYVGMNVSDVERAADYYLETMGTTEVDRDADGTRYLSIGYDHHDIILRPAQEKSLLNVGFQLYPDTDMDALVKEANDFGVKAQRKSDSLPGVKDLVEIEGPGGVTFHLYEKIEASVPGFKTSGIAPVKLGHLAYITPEGEKLVAFYRDFLGFWETDWVGPLMTFMTCNADHHCVNVVNAPITKIHHVAFQLRDNADHMRACDLLLHSGIKTEWGPARHTAGHNIAGYHFDPERTLIELYTDMDVWLPELGHCAPRAWHQDLPMKPRVWHLDEVTSWQNDYVFNLGRDA